MWKRLVGQVRTFLKSGPSYELVDLVMEETDFIK